MDEVLDFISGTTCEQQHADTTFVRAEDILHSETPLALRLSGMLMLGVVRIYKRQLQYLFDDCQSTISKLEKVCSSSLRAVGFWHLIAAVAC